MAYWAVIIPPERWLTERLFHHDTLRLAVGEARVADGEVLPAAGGAGVADGEVLPAAGGAGVADGEVLPAGGGAQVVTDDEVLLIADEHVVALARAGKADREGDLVLTYLRRSFDAPVPVDGLALTGPVSPVDAATFRRLAASLGVGRGRDRAWLVSLALPIEAPTPAEAVRQFWSHVLELGPAELPAYVWPTGDELAMQTFVLGEEANQDPEEEDDED